MLMAAIFSFAVIGCSSVPDDYAFWSNKPLTADDIFLQEPEEISAERSNNERDTERSDSQSERISSAEVIPDQELMAPDITAIADMAVDRPPRINPATETPGEALRAIQKRLLRDHTYAYIYSDFVQYVEPIAFQEEKQPVGYISPDGQTEIVMSDLSDQAYPVEQQIEAASPIYLPANIQINFEGLLLARPEASPLSTAKAGRQHYIYGLDMSAENRARMQNSLDQRHNTAHNLALSAPQANRSRPTDRQPFAARTMAEGRIVINDVFDRKSGPVKMVMGANGAQLYFSHGSAVISEKEKQKLEKLAEIIKNKQTTLQIIGHASKRVEVKDETRARIVNLKMSEKRTNAVIKRMADLGVDAELIEPFAFGDSLPNPSPEGGMDQEAADRRVQVLF